MATRQRLKLIGARQAITIEIQQAVHPVASTPMIQIEPVTKTISLLKTDVTENAADDTLERPAYRLEFKPRATIVQKVEPELVQQLPEETIQEELPKQVASASSLPMVAVDPIVVNVGHDDETPVDLSQNRSPEYPAEAIAIRAEGVVRLKLTIDERGQVIKVQIVESSGHASLDNAAANAVRTWKGKPATRDGRPVIAEEILPIRFRL